MWIITAVMLMIAVLCTSVGAQTQPPAPDVRIDTFDAKSNRTGYIVVNPNTGRIDQFDKNSNRLGYGQINGSGSNQRIDTFTPNGTRTGSGTLPTTPRR